MNTREKLKELTSFAYFKKYQAFTEAKFKSSLMPKIFLIQTAKKRSN
jgi:hypothetical protein